jgi:two-component system, NtrC family, sensor kinase
LSIGTRILYIIIFVSVLYAGLSFGIQLVVVFPSFVELEKSEAREDVERITGALQREIHHLDSLAYDWAAWDDTYEFMQTEDENYLESNLAFGTFIDSDVNLIYLVDLDGAVIWGEIYNLESEERLRLEEFPADRLPSTHDLLRHDDPESSISGVFVTSSGPMLLASRPIVTSEGVGPIRGTLLMARLLTDEHVTVLSEQTRVDMEVWSLASDSVPESARTASTKISSESPYLIDYVGAERLLAFTICNDIAGNPALLFQADIERKIARKGRESLLFASLSLLVAGAFIVLAFLLLLRNSVLRPVSLLTQHVVSLGQDSYQTTVSVSKHDDEIGLLAREFDRMVENLTQTRERLVDQSFSFGKAEMAAGVLHNVRNALHPILGRLVMIRTDLRNLPAKKIKSAVTNLEVEDLDPDRRKDLTRYIALGLTDVMATIEDANEKLGSLFRSVEHAEAFLAGQDKAALAVAPVESFKLENLVRDAVSLVDDELLSGVKVRLAPELSELGWIDGRRTILLQVLANIIQNGAESIRQSAKNGELNVYALEEAEGSSTPIHIRVCDTGVGMSSEDLEKAFARGFSTKKRDHSGIGLHWCANAINAMGGRIFAESDGVGGGACIHVVVPRRI